MKAYVLTTIDATPQTTFVVAGAEIELGIEALQGRIFTAARGGEMVVVAEIADATAGRINLVRKVHQGGLSAHAIVETRNGLTAIIGVQLKLSSGSLAFTDSQQAVDLPSDTKWWWPAVVAAAARDRPKLPPASRPPGVDVLALEITGTITGENARNTVDEIIFARGQTIALTIDSEGGSLDGALSIYGALGTHDALVEVMVYRAHSAAAIVALAGDHRIIASDGSFLLHRPTISADALNADELRSQAAELDAFAADIAAIVASQTDHDFSLALEWASGEKWFSAGQAVLAGLVHAVADNVPSVPRPPRARVAPIAGPYRGVSPAALQRAPILENGRIYHAGDRVRFNGKVYRAKRRAVGAGGRLQPDVDHAQWERVRP